MKTTTLESYLAQACQTNKQLEGIDSLILALAKGIIDVRSVIRQVEHKQANEFHPTLKSAMAADRFLKVCVSNTLISALAENRHIAAIGSVDSHHLVPLGSHASNNFNVLMSPLDSLSSITLPSTKGSIFGIWPNGSAPYRRNFQLRPGNEQAAALYVVYEPSTILVITTGEHVQGFSFNPQSRTFELTHPDISYARPIGSSTLYSEPYPKQTLPADRSTLSNPANSLVTEFHRSLVTEQNLPFWHQAPVLGRKLRLMYEANPLGFIIDKAGGLAL